MSTILGDGLYRAAKFFGYSRDEAEYNGFLFDRRRLERSIKNIYSHNEVSLDSAINSAKFYFEKKSATDFIYKACIIGSLFSEPSKEIEELLKSDPNDDRIYAVSDIADKFLDNFENFKVLNGKVKEEIDSAANYFRGVICVTTDDIEKLAKNLSYITMIKGHIRGDNFVKAITNNVMHLFSENQIPPVQADEISKDLIRIICKFYKNRGGWYGDECPHKELLFALEKVPLEKYNDTLAILIKATFTDKDYVSVSGAYQHIYKVPVNLIAYNGDTEMLDMVVNSHMDTAKQENILNLFAARGKHEYARVFLDKMIIQDKNWPIRDNNENKIFTDLFCNYEENIYGENIRYLFNSVAENGKYTDTLRHTVENLQKNYADTDEITDKDKRTRKQVKISGFIKELLEDIKNKNPDMAAILVRDIIENSGKDSRTAEMITIANELLFSPKVSKENLASLSYALIRRGEKTDNALMCLTKISDTEPQLILKTIPFMLNNDIKTRDGLFNYILDKFENSNKQKLLNSALLAGTLYFNDTQDIAVLKRIAVLKEKTPPRSVIMNISTTEITNKANKRS